MTLIAIYIKGDKWTLNTYCAVQHPILKIESLASWNTTLALFGTRLCLPRIVTQTTVFITICQRPIHMSSHCYSVWNEWTTVWQYAIYVAEKCGVSHNTISDKYTTSEQESGSPQMRSSGSVLYVTWGFIFPTLLAIIWQNVDDLFYNIPNTLKAV